MSRQISVGIDIGTSEVKVVIAEEVIEHGKNTTKIIGTGTSESKGVYRGYIKDTGEAAKAVEIALRKAEKTSGIKVKRAYVSFGGIGLSSVVSNGSVIISRADLEITENDVELALEAAEALIPPAVSLNKRIINVIPIEYKIDGKPVLGQAVGLKAQKLEVKALFVACLEHHLANLFTTIEEVGVEVIDVVAEPIAASFVTLSKKQKRAGCLLADFGAETLSIIVFENNNVLSLEVFPFGSNDLTHDIALGFKVNPENAENIKIGNDRGMTYQKKKLEEIILAWLKSCFEYIDTHLKSIGRNALLPAGIIIIGGGASTTGIKIVAENFLKLPSQIGEVYFGDTVEGKVKNHTWAIACGLSIFGFNNSDNERSIGIRSGSGITENGRRWGKIIKNLISQILP